MWRQALLILVFLFAHPALYGQASEAQPAFVPGEILLKLQPGSPAADLLEEAEAGDRRCYSAFYQYLLGDVQVPFRPPVRHSGGVVLITVDFEAMTRQIEQRASELPEIREVNVLATDTARPAAWAPIDLSFRLAIQAEHAQEYQQMWIPKSNEGSALAESILGDANYFTEVRAADSEDLVVVISSLDLTQKLANHLSAHADVEFVQLNYISEQMGGMVP